MSDVRDKLKAAQKAAGIRPGQRKEKPPEEPEEAPSCPDIVELTSRTDTPAATRYRSGADSVRCKRIVIRGEREYRFAEAAVDALAEDLMDALNGTCRLTIDIYRIDED